MVDIFFQIITPRLLNSYFWLIDYLVSSSLSEILRKPEVMRMTSGSFIIGLLIIRKLFLESVCRALEISRPIISVC